MQVFPCPDVQSALTEVMFELFSELILPLYLTENIFILSDKKFKKYINCN